MNPVPELVPYLKQLRLSGLLESLDVRLQEGASHNLNHAEFLELALQDELAVRSDRLLQRRNRARKIHPQQMRIGAWQFIKPKPQSQRLGGRLRDEVAEAHRALGHRPDEGLT